MVSNYQGSEFKCGGLWCVNGDIKKNIYGLIFNYTVFHVEMLEVEIFHVNYFSNVYV